MADMGMRVIRMDVHDIVTMLYLMSRLDDNLNQMFTVNEQVRQTSCTYASARIV